MSKAFTRDDDDASFELASRVLVVKGPVTSMGARLAAERIQEITSRLASETDASARAVLEMERARATALAAAPVAPRPAHEDKVSFGAEVRFRDLDGGERIAMLTSADEIGLVPHAASLTSPVARALLGARAGDEVEFHGPRGSESLLLIEVRFPE
jgi:transcription elongation GreA/GreB family factor